MRRITMATFILLMNFTDQGIRNVKDTLMRFEAFRALVDAQGGTIKNAYWTLGGYDVVFIVEGTEEAMMTASLKLGSLGNVRTQTLRGFTADEMKKLISKMP
jgi:uncharacterized protein with GYD domain